jgi:predicted RNA-binding protein YlqC (UPF0109 family)
LPNSEVGIETLVLWMVRSLVDYSDEVDVEAIQTENETRFQVTVAKPDMGRVIGKDGQTVKAIRTVLSGIAMAGKVHGRESRYKLEVVSKH